VDDETISNLATLIVTAAVVVGGLLIFGMVLLFRNRDGAKPSAAAGLTELRTKANGQLVHLDETLSNADNELGFAIAQFGDEKTKEYATAVQKARVMSTAAFRARQQLDDAFPEPVTKQRELALQIIALCESAQDTLDKEQAAFTALRSAEVEAPQSLSALRKNIAAARKRIPLATATLKRLAKDYRPQIAEEHSRAIAEATTQLEAASDNVAAAEKQLSPAGVNAVTGDVRDAELALSRATTLLDAIDTTEKELDGAAAAVVDLIASTRADLTEARRGRDSAPDPDTGAAIIDAIEGVEKVLAAVAGDARPSDPIENLDRLNAAIAELDTALASARNQAQRLEHARTALVGTLVSARSQLAATRGFMAAGGGRVGADARVRLSEAERELKNAEAEADPVDALDAARRAVTSARDADALARYDAMKTFG
jgi:hypothetical protein